MPLVLQVVREAQPVGRAVIDDEQRSRNGSHGFSW
jgi:hypothetical protein